MVSQSNGLHHFSKLAKMKILLIILFIYVTESRISQKNLMSMAGSHRNIRRNMTTTSFNNRTPNDILPIVNKNMVFDTRSYDEEALQLLLNNDDQQDQSEELSGDFQQARITSDRRSHKNEEEVEDETEEEEQDEEETNKIKWPTHTGTKAEHLTYQNGWIQYKYEKAFILVNRTATRKEAEDICQSFNQNEDNGAEMAVPQTDEEQSFLNHYMFNISKCFKNVWIGQNTINYRNSSKHFKLYSNWGKGRPTMTKPCVQIRSPYTIYADMDGFIGGKWEDVSCHRKNLVLCQKPQHWSQHQFIRALTDLKKDVESFKQKSGIDTVPIGFIYTQLPNQPSPNLLWPKNHWKDVSTLYSGLFFRVLGGGSAHLGHVQEESSPRLDGIKSYGIHTVPKDEMRIKELKADNIWSDKRSGHKETGLTVGYKISNDPVVPKNTAVIIWKCI